MPDPFPLPAQPLATPTPPDRFPSAMSLLCRACGARTHGEAGQVAMCRRCYKTLDPTNVDTGLPQAAPDRDDRPWPSARRRARGRGVLGAVAAVLLVLVLALWARHATGF